MMQHCVDAWYAEAKNAECNAHSEDELSLFQHSMHLHQTRQSLTSAHKFFCWAVVTASDQTIQDIQKQMQKCDGYMMLSNFADSTQNIVHLFDDNMEDNKVFGWRNLTIRFAKAWEYVAQITERKNYDWYVKVDPDTFFRPQLLSQRVSWFDPSKPVGLGVNGLMQGAMQVVSNGAVFNRLPGTQPFFKNPMSTIMSPDCFLLEKYVEKKPGDLEEGPQLMDPNLAHWPNINNGCWWEDLWLTVALKRSGATVMNDHLIDQCYALIYNSNPTYATMPTCIEHEIYDKAGNVVPTIFDKPTHCRSGKEASGLLRLWSVPQCMNQDVVAIHPVKDASKYRQLQLLDHQHLQNKSPSS